MPERSDSPEAEEQDTRWTWRSWALLALQPFGIATMAYVFAYDTISGSWANLLALPIWGLLIAGGLATAVIATRSLPRGMRIGLLVVALGAAPIAKAIAPALEPLARAHRQVRIARSHASHEELVHRHCRELSAELNGARRVVDTAGWFVILEGGYGVKMVGVDTRDELSARLADRLVGRTVTVRVAPDCPDRYIADGASGLLYDRGLVPDGQGHSYGAVPAYLWSDTIFWNRVFARPSRRKYLDPPPRPSR